MAVLKSKRKESPVEYLQQARNLEIYFLRESDRKAKKHHDFMYDNYVKPSVEVYNIAKLFANQKLKGDDYQKMKSIALYKLSCIAGQLDIFFEVFKADGLTDSEFEELVCLTETTKELISRL